MTSLLTPKSILNQSEALPLILSYLTSAVLVMQALSGNKLFLVFPRRIT